MEVSDAATIDTCELPEPFGGLGIQHRQAFRVRMHLPVHVESPMHTYCETLDMSVLGARFDRDLPCTPGVEIGFTLEIPNYGVDRPRELQLQAEVVRVREGDTGVRFVDLTPDQNRAVRELVNEQQRMILNARRAVSQGLFRVGPQSCRLA
jgi:hypothetical protein